MILEIVSWNVRQLNVDVKGTTIKSLLQIGKVTIVCVQETEMVSTTEEMVRSV